MVKLYHLAVLYRHHSKAISLCSASDLTTFGYFQRNSVQEFMNFSSQILVERCHPASRMSVKEQDSPYFFYIIETQVKSKPEPDEIGNVIEYVVDLARQINLEADSDEVQELLDSHN
ncbi:UNVERIFIED_CONTAM: Synaptobrevin-like protein YKT6 [Trichonephila clavipes]